MLRLLSSTAIALVLAGGPLMAQSDAPAPAANESTDAYESESSSVIWERADEAWVSDDLIGAEVVNASDETLGEIEQLLVAVADAPADAPAESESPAAAAPGSELDSSASIDGGAESPAAGAPAGESDAGGADSAMNDGFAPESEAAPESFAMDGMSDREMTDSEATQELPEAGSEPDMAQSETDSSTAPEGDVAEGGTLYSEPLPSEGESVMTPSEPAIADLAVTDIVIGVGGFLGIGEKRVAIPIERFEFYTGDNSEKKIVLNATSEELEGLPDYVERDDGLASDEFAPAPTAQ